MMKKVRALAIVLMAGFAFGSYATDARVAVMGRQPTPWFYRDEVTIFNNPADMSLYPNMIYGSFGWLSNRQQDMGTTYNYQVIDPNDPHFGAVISHRFSEDDNGALLSLGAFLNRRDNMLSKLMEEGGRSGGATNLVEPVGKLDVMASYDAGNGLAVGLGFYTAFQNDIKKTVLVNQTEYIRGALGVNWEIDKGLDFEASVNAGVANARYNAAVGDVPANIVVVSDNEWALRGDVRIFSAVPAINGSFVPQVSLALMTLNEKDMLDLNGGVGINMNIDRGFFWAGLQGVYSQVNDSKGNSEESSIGARISFGIERNIVWDWFLIRVGGQKEVRHVNEKQDTDSRWSENASSDGTDGDLVGLGFGVNIDNRLRIDFVVSEALPYTFTNLFSGGQHHLFSRVSATYRF